MSTSTNAHAPAAPGGRSFRLPRADAEFALLAIVGRRTTIGVQVAGSFRSRLAGWLGLRSPPRARGLWIAPCDAVHTFAMRFPIDVVFVDAAGVVRRVDSAVRPWRIRVCIGARSAIELAAGEAQALGIRAGDQLETRCV